MADLVTIKKIRTAAGDHLIDATYLGGHTFEQIESMVHGGVETYVIPSSKSSVTGYTTIVDSTESTLVTTKTVLDSLTDGQANGGYKLGDVILMEATSDGKKVFDRWVSKVDGDNITLAVLETQVAKHHHTVSVTTSKAKALTSATPTTTTNAIPTVGSAVTVLTGTSGEVITSVVHDDEGGHDLAIATATSADGIGHSHTVKSHSHDVKFTPNTLVSQNVAAYTSLTSANYTPHTHTNTTVAGAHVDGSKFTYATGGGSTDTFIKTLTDSSSTTNTGGRELTTNANTAGLTTSTQASTDTVGSTVLTLSNGAHTHTVTTTTTSNVVTDVTLAGNVTTSAKLNYTAPTVQASVITGLTYTSAKVVYSASLTGTTTFMSTWSASVDDSGVLSFATSTASVGISAPTKTMASKITVTTKSQSAGSASLTTTSATQTYTSGKVGASGSAASAGSHQHGFSHTHAIPSHTHGVASHTHTYVKTVASTTGSAYTSLSTGSYTPHTHTNATVAGAHANGSAFKYLTGGSTTDVVRNLKDAEQSYTSGTSSPGTDTKYYKLSGDITFPGLTLGKKTLSTTTVTPAVAGTEKPIKSITYGSISNFVTGVTVDNSGKTSTNIGGE